MVPNVDVDTCNDDEMNAQSDSSNQAETSKMTPKELRTFMLRSTDNFGKVLHSEPVPPKPVKVTQQEIRDYLKNYMDDPGKALRDKYDQTEINNKV